MTAGLQLLPTLIISTLLPLLNGHLQTMLIPSKLCLWPLKKVTALIPALRRQREALSLRPAWTRVPGELGIHREILSGKKKEGGEKEEEEEGGGGEGGEEEEQQQSQM